MKKTKPLYSSPCSLGEIEEQNKEKTLKDVYSLIAELWNSPPENNKKRESGNIGVWVSLEINIMLKSC